MKIFCSEGKQHLTLCQSSNVTHIHRAPFSGMRNKSLTQTSPWNNPSLYSCPEDFLYLRRYPFLFLLNFSPVHHRAIVSWIGCRRPNKKCTIIARQGIQVVISVPFYFALPVHNSISFEWVALCTAKREAQLFFAMSTSATDTDRSKQPRWPRWDHVLPDSSLRLRRCSVRSVVTKRKMNKSRAKTKKMRGCFGE